MYPQTERCMVNICEGTMTKNDMLVQSIEQYKEMYIRTRAEFERLVTVRMLAFLQCVALAYTYPDSAFAIVCARA